MKILGERFTPTSPKKCGTKWRYTSLNDNYEILQNGDIWLVLEKGLRLERFSERTVWRFYRGRKANGRKVNDQLDAEVIDEEI